MRFGLCLNMQAADPQGIGLNHLAEALQAGVDYLELPMAQMMSLDDQAFERLVIQPVADTGLEVYSSNNFLPATQRLTGGSADHTAAFQYAQRAFDRAQALGISCIVVGSGGARNLPDGFPLEQGIRQFEDFLCLIAPHAEARGIQLVIEPLNRSESNLIHTLSDGVQIARRVNHPAVAALVDYYHMSLSDEGIEGIEKAGKLLAHVHLARPLGRSMPGYAEEEPYLAFFRALKGINYSGNLSLEAYAPEPYLKHVQKALQLMRTLWAEA